MSIWSPPHTWIRRHPDTAQALALARDIADWSAAERRWIALETVFGRDAGPAGRR